jgi:16S rRNA (cytosine967-C5)-methyltransferase
VRGRGGKTLALARSWVGAGGCWRWTPPAASWKSCAVGARRAGLSNVVAREIQPGKPLPAEARAGCWDRVLVDAPCSGLGTLRRNPEARWRLTAKDLERFPPLQLSLLVDYAPLVAVGGA